MPGSSVSQVGHDLRTAALQPHRRKMWINTTEKDRAIFEQQVAAVCQTYQPAAQRQQADGTRTVCIDEMTGLPALERAAPDKPVRAGEVAKQEFEYVRHGTTTRIGNGDVVQGAMFAETIGPTRTEPDFVAHSEQTVATKPEVPWVIVVDGLQRAVVGLLGRVDCETRRAESAVGKKKGDRACCDPTRLAANFCLIRSTAFGSCSCPNTARGSTKSKSSSAS